MLLNFLNFTALDELRLKLERMVILIADQPFSMPKTWK